MIDSFDVVCVGKVNVDTISGSDFLGGSATNTAFGLARLGLRVGLIAKVGNDGLGKFAIAELNKVGVDTSQIKTANAKTGSHSMVAESWKKELTGKFGANAFFLPEDISEEYIKKTKLVHICSVSYDTAKRAVELAVKNSKFVSIDPGFILSRESFEKMKELLVHADFAFLTENELLTLSGEKKVSDAVKRILSTGVDTLLVKRKETLLCSCKDEEFELRLPKEKIVDLTGIGDNFAAGFLYGFMTSKTKRESIGVGMKTAKKCAERVGGCIY
jgi:sugar/nucleoside kinase (ribokinase family)